MLRGIVLTATAAVFLACNQDAGLQRASAASPPALPPRQSPVVSAVPAHESVRAPTRTALIPAGSRIRVRLAQTLDTRYTQTRATFSATLHAPIVVGNRVVVPKGTPLHRGVVVS